MNTMKTNEMLPEDFNSELKTLHRRVCRIKGMNEHEIKSNFPMFLNNMFEGALKFKVLSIVFAILAGVLSRTSGLPEYGCVLMAALVYVMNEIYSFMACINGAQKLARV
jgi:hypothetical protein